MSTLKTLFVSSWRRMKARYGLLMATMYLPMLVVVFGMLVILPLLYVVWLQEPRFGLGEGGEAGLTAVLVLLGIIAVLAAIYILLVGFIGAYYAAFSSEKKSFWACMNKGKELFWFMLWQSFLSGLIMYGAFFLFGIPGIYLSLAFVFAPILLILHGTKGFGSLIQSKDLVKGKWWALLGIYLAIGIVVYIPVIIFAAIGDTENTTVSVIGMALYLAYCYLFLAPFFLSWFAEIFEWLLQKKGGIPPVKDLQARRWKYAALTAGGYLLAIIVFLSMATAWSSLGDV